MTAKFRWLGRSTVTRSKDGSVGTALEQGHIYDTAQFDPLILEEWVITRNAEFVVSEAKNTVLAVHSPTVKAKAPKLGAN